MGPAHGLEPPTSTPLAWGDPQGAFPGVADQGEGGRAWHALRAPGLSRTTDRRPGAPPSPDTWDPGGLCVARRLLWSGRMAPVLALAVLLAAPSAQALSPDPTAVLPPLRLLARLAAGDPPIARVQAAAAAAVEEAVPDPAALAARRRLAALLPRVSAELKADQRSYRVVGLQGTSEVDYLRSSPGTSVSVQATWELPDLVVGRGEPASASAALTRLRRREEAVRRATLLYYERRRLLVLLALDPPTTPLARAEAELELDRRTAELDAVTGGLFGGRERP